MYLRKTSVPIVGDLEGLTLDGVLLLQDAWEVIDENGLVVKLLTSRKEAEDWHHAYNPHLRLS